MDALVVLWFITYKIEFLLKGTLMPSLLPNGRDVFEQLRQLVEERYSTDTDVMK
jgi:hypothetical protein